MKRQVLAVAAVTTALIATLATAESASASTAGDDVRHTAANSNSNTAVPVTQNDANFSLPAEASSVASTAQPATNRLLAGDWTLVGVYDTWKLCYSDQQAYEEAGYQAYCALDWWTNQWNLKVYL